MVEVMAVAGEGEAVRAKDIVEDRGERSVGGETEEVAWASAVEREGSAEDATSGVGYYVIEAHSVMSRVRRDDGFAVSGGPAVDTAIRHEEKKCAVLLDGEAADESSA